MPLNFLFWNNIEFQYTSGLKYNGMGSYPIHTQHKEHVASFEPFRLCWILYLVPAEGSKPCSESRTFRASRHQLIHRTHSTGHTEVWGSPSWERTHRGWGWNYWARPAIPAFWWCRWGGWNLWLRLSPSHGQVYQKQVK